MIPWDDLPELMDRPGLRDRLGLKRCDIDRVFDMAVVYRIPGSSKPYVTRDSVRDLLVASQPAPRRAA